MNIIKVKNLTVNYDKSPAIWDLNFSIPSGSSVGIIGPNGGGKTTLVKSMIGLIPITSGEISFCGKTLKEVRGKIAYVPQKKNIDWDFPITVLEVVLMGVYGKLGLFKRVGKKDKDMAFSILERLGMDKFANRHIGALSGGQQQRLFVARALLQGGDFYFFDEPFTCIDKTTEKLIVDIFLQLINDGKSIFVVHHDLSTVKNYFNHLIMLNKRLITHGSVENVYNMDNLSKTFGQSGSSLFEEALNLNARSCKGTR